MVWSFSTESLRTRADTPYLGLFAATMPPRRRNRERLAVLALLLAAALVGAPVVRAQDACPLFRGRELAGSAADVAAPPCPWLPSPGAPSVARAQLVNFTTTAALGAVTAGVRAWREQRPIWRAIAGGALGGAAVYAGKRIVGTGGRGTGFLGREVVAVGASMVRNASDGRGVLAAAILPVGPLRVHLGELPDNGVGAPRTRVRLDLAGTIALAFMATRPGARFDTRASLSAGVPVFRGVRMTDRYYGARTLANVVAVGAGVDPTAERATIAHEMVHVTQYDASATAWGEEAERVLLPRLPGGPLLRRVADAGVVVALFGAGNSLVSYGSRPWEREAYLMSEPGRQ